MRAVVIAAVTAVLRETLTWVQSRRKRAFCFVLLPIRFRPLAKALVALRAGVAYETERILILLQLFLFF